MNRQITLVFHNQGLRSYIEVDLCAECPRQDDKGCCGNYSPVFYPTDLAYLYLNYPGLIDFIFQQEHITVLDYSVTVNNDKDGTSYKCKFHTRTGGCILSQLQRETICRHFVCPGIAWEKENKLQPWKIFFERLFDYEIELNDNLAAELKARGLTLKKPAQRQALLVVLSRLYRDKISHPPVFLNSCPPEETFTITRSIAFGTNWPL